MKKLKKKKNFGKNSQMVTLALRLSFSVSLFGNGPMGRHGWATQVLNGAEQSRATL